MDSKVAAELWLTTGASRPGSFRDAALKRLDG